MKEKGFSLPLLLAVFTVLIVVGGVYYLGTTKNRLQTQNPTTTSVSSPTQDETVNWKTYMNTIAGYEIKYPPFLNVTERDFGGNYRITVISDMELAESAVFPAGDDILVTATGDQAGLITPEIYKGFLLDIRWAVSSYISPEGLSKREKLNINGWNAYKLDDSFKSNGYEGKYSHVVVEDPFKDQLELNASFNGNKKDYVGLFDKMLATFKFLEDAQTNIEFPPLYSNVDWKETTYQEKYPFRSKTIVGGIVEKGATITTSKIYKDVSENLVEGFSNYYRGWLESRGWRGGGTDLKRYRLGDYEYYRKGHYVRFGLSADKIKKDWMIGESDFRFYVVHD